MECPICKTKNHVEFDNHADGFAKDLFECGTCGATWSEGKDGVKLLHGRTLNSTPGHRTGECPFCHNHKYVELDMHADGFSNDLMECGFCGAVWTGGTNNINILHGPTWPQVATF